MTIILCDDTDCKSNKTKHRNGEDEPVTLCGKDEIAVRKVMLVSGTSHNVCKRGDWPKWA